MRALELLFCFSLSFASCGVAARASEARGEGPFSGTWFGAFVVTNPDGSISHDKAVIVLQQHGSELTGSAGPTIDQQTPFSNGKIEAGSIRFHVKAQGEIEFALHGTPRRLVGLASGKSMKADLDLAPAPGLLPHEKLYEEITDADNRMFAAFGACDAPRFRAFLSEDLEFYHDRVGKQDYRQNLLAMKRRCAEGIVLRREVVKETMTVNAAPGFGAIEAGTHRFYSKQADGSEHLDATAQFTNVWSKASGRWKLVRAVSFDHH